ncbi:hypothetical protein [Streptomyces sp. NBC_01296]|uniref:hypothetical protein n=1 Tax=Streptomyces sp. NBC_01296 TaxID=2903816 RepID=UPI002E117FAC|nr:hypothetical protein OG299_40210 [Streptomyces sp. NBC_01296]
MEDGNGTDSLNSDAGASSHQRRTKPWVRWLEISAGVATIAGLVVAVLQLAGDPPKEPDRTEVHLLRLFRSDGSLLPPYQEDGHGAAKCQNSRVSSDPDALRCFSNEAIRDPCWPFVYPVSGLPRRAACLASPWEKKVWIVDDPTIDRQPRPTDVSPGEGYPWAIALKYPSGGSQSFRCVYNGGAANIISGERMNYDCRTAENPAVERIDGYAVGQINATTDLWKISYAPEGNSSTTQADVTEVWR